MKPEDEAVTPLGYAGASRRTADGQRSLSELPVLRAYKN